MLGIALTGVVAAAIAAILAPLGWPFELFVHFRWQLAAACIALLAAAFALRRPWLMAVALVALVLPFLPGSALFGGKATASTTPNVCSAGELRVVTANAWFAATEHAALLDWLRRSDADVIALQEVTPAWEAALEPLTRQYPHRKVIARTDPYGIALLSRWPVVGAIVEADLAGDGRPSLVATLERSGRRLQVIVLHTRWPVLPALLPLRDRALQQAAQLAAARPDTTVLLGDLNITPFAPAFARLLDESRLRDALADELWRPTWLAGFWPLALPIDHVLVPRGSCVTAHEIGPYVGSDHRPLQVTLRLP
jgi:endonuclease/exonuclease/phosphatase (EEP) superfamily protein YafD